MTLKDVGFKPFINRELSWLAFNERVLEEAQDPNYPLLERLKFIAIVSSNLDEFFMIRVAGLERKARRQPTAREADGMRIDEVLYQIREWVLSQKARQGNVLREILEKLKEQGFYLQTQIPAEPALLEKAATLLPDVKVQTFTKIDQLNSLDGGKIYVFVRLKDKFGILSLAENSDRFIPVPAELARAKHHFVLAEKLLVGAAQNYFPGDAVLEAFPFKLIRDADVKIDPDTDPEDLLTTVEEAIRGRAKMPVVRLEVDAASISDGALLIANGLKLHSRSIYRYDVPMDLKILWRMYYQPGYEALKFPDVIEKKENLPQRVPDLVKIIRGQDILLHHPYDSFETVVKLIEAAAQDPDVTAIRQTLYRTNRGSPIVAALIEAAKRGKNVTVFVELRARFDEAHNIQLAKELKKYGVTVLQGFPDKKIHCKITQIIRKENRLTTSFVHVGTGNYNPNTAKLYTDLSLLTADKSFGRDAEKVFKSIKGGRLPRNLEAFLSAPAALHKKLMALIRAETKRARAGNKNCRIVAKVNALVDTELVQALYKASQAGVKIDLIVRGICVLRPGVPGLSENIRVISIVERYLEHSRIYYFQNGDHPLVFLSSADWMPRNFHERLELAFPVFDVDLKKYVKEVILENLIKDNQKARQLMPDGQWTRVQPVPEEPPHRAQEIFERLAMANYKGTPLYSRFTYTRDDVINIPPAPAASAAPAKAVVDKL